MSTANLIRRLKRRHNEQEAKQAPKIKKDSARYFALLYVSTDPRGTWTQKDMLNELTDLGVPKSTAQYAIDGLNARGLIRKSRRPNAFDKLQTYLYPTSAGLQAIKPFIPQPGRDRA